MHFRVDANPRIVNGNFHAWLIGRHIPSTHRNGTAIGCEFDRIHNDMIKHFLQHIRVGRDEGQIAQVIHVKLQISLDQRLFKIFVNLPNDQVNPQTGLSKEEGIAVNAGNIQHAFHNAGHAFGTIQNPLRQRL